MREFHIKDISQGFGFRGIMPSNDVDCQPLDYFRLSHAELSYKIFSEILKIKCPVFVPECQIKKFVLEQVDESITEMLALSAPKPEIHKLLANDSLSLKEQVKLLRGIKLNATDILWLNKEAQDLGYLLDVYHEEVYPIKFGEKQIPIAFHQKDDSSVESIGSTDMSEGEMRALLEQRKVVQARIFHKGSHWHCFYFTFKGLEGKENGTMGGKPHWHYLSDKLGILWDDLLRGIKSCNMPSSKVHIIIER